MRGLLLCCEWVRTSRDQKQLALLRSQQNADAVMMSGFHQGAPFAFTQSSDNTIQYTPVGYVSVRA